MFPDPGLLQPSVLVERKWGARQLILNQPRRLNSINIEMIDTMLSNLMAWEISDEAKIILLKGAGRAFCAGEDAKDLSNKTTDPNRHHELDRQVYTHYDSLRFMATIKASYIAIMDGVTNPDRFEDIDSDRDTRARHFSINNKLNLTNSQDFYVHPHKKYVLPTEEEILCTKGLH
ncbi:ClpP/crotonase-like domain-containing protein [Helicostylum pulchrum]|nr:ClpP/crotonase-like domain-containing protein [Helicostylum pulchrum]